MLFVFLTTVLREGTVALRPEVVLPQQLLLVVLLGPLDEPRVQRERSARRTAEFERSPRARNRTSGEAPCGPSTTRPRGFACCRRRASALRPNRSPGSPKAFQPTKPRESSARAFRRPGPFRPFSTRWPAIIPEVRVLFTEGNQNAQRLLHEERRAVVQTAGSLTVTRCLGPALPSAAPLRSLSFYFES